MSSIALLSALLSVATPTTNGPRVPDALASFQPSDATCKALHQTWQKELTRAFYRGECEGKECTARHKAFMEYRTRRYGRYEKRGRKAWNDAPPHKYAARTLFMGLKVRLNWHLVPLLACIERDLKAEAQTCKEDPRYPGECERKTFPYQPKRLSGLRLRNTFRGREVSNHVFGIAIDLDPAHNTCCGCVGRWRAHKWCKRKDLRKFERMVMPMQWVDVFERYGFYWLGRDKLQDTMHFEFLGKPELVSGVVTGNEAAPQ